MKECGLKTRRAHLGNSPHHIPNWLVPFCLELRRFAKWAPRRRLRALRVRLRRISPSASLRCIPVPPYASRRRATNKFPFPVPRLLPAAPKHGARGDTGARSDIWSELPRRDVAIMSTALRCRQVRLGPAPTTNSVAPCLRHLAAAWGTPSGLRPSASATSLRSLSV